MFLGVRIALLAVGGFIVGVLTYIGWVLWHSG